MVGRDDAVRYALFEAPDSVIALFGCFLEGVRELSAHAAYLYEFSRKNARQGQTK